jgi:hypothetical protein
MLLRVASDLVDAQDSAFRGVGAAGGPAREPYRTVPYRVPSLDLGLAAGRTGPVDVQLTYTNLEPIDGTRYGSLGGDSPPAGRTLTRPVEVADGAVKACGGRGQLSAGLAAISGLAPYTPGHPTCAVVQGFCLYAWVEAEKQLLLAPR